MILAYSFAAVCLFLFSFTQVDLSLTISQVGLLQSIEKMFQYVGFYERPWATAWYVGLLVLFFCLYAFSVSQARRGYLTKKTIWQIVYILSLVLLFSYPAFSYDIFNYMFTAKTVLVYHKNPYTVVPLAFTGVEPWLSFMRWTHLPSAYTPFWIAITLPFYLLGLGYFLPTLWSIKSIAVLSYLGVVWLTQSILSKKDPANVAVGMAIVALNPLMLFETLVSGHNDIVMMFFALMAVWATVNGKTLKAFALMAAATGTKFMTIFTLPVVFFGYKPWWFLLAMGIGLLAVITQREILPWYWVWIVPFVALMPRIRWVTVFAGAVSLGLLFIYAPYFYFGHWNAPVPELKFWGSLAPPVLAGIFLLAKKQV